MQRHAISSGKVSEDIREEARIHGGVRRELGPEYEDEVVDSFVEKVEDVLGGGRVSAGSGAGIRTSLPDRYVASSGLLAPAICMGIPLTIVAAAVAGLPGVVVVWGSIALLATHGGRGRRVE